MPDAFPDVEEHRFTRSFEVIRSIGCNPLNERYQPIDLLHQLFRRELHPHFLGPHTRKKHRVSGQSDSCLSPPGERFPRPLSPATLHPPSSRL
jgi:hypothetical protein